MHMGKETGDISQHTACMTENFKILQRAKEKPEKAKLACKGKQAGFCFWRSPHETHLSPWGPLKSSLLPTIKVSESREV